MKRLALGALAAGAWINLSEFLRNELLFKQQWLDKYQSLGLSFPSAPGNNALWAAWGFILAACIVTLIRRQTFLATFLAVWTLTFPLMWIVTANLNVLPLGLLPVAVPWSMAEAAVAVVIARRIAGGRKAEPEN